MSKLSFLIPIGVFMLSSSLVDCQQIINNNETSVAAVRTDGSADVRTIGGKEVGTYDFSSIVRIAWGCKRFCAGTLVDDKTIITAASCLNPCHIDKDKCFNSSFSIQVGFDAESKPSLQIKRGFEVVNQIGFRRCAAENDIALIKLRTSIPLHLIGTYHRNRITLPNKEPIDHSDDHYVLGWGGDHRALQITKTYTTANEECMVDLPDMRPIQVCTLFPEEAGICTSDVGGPLLRRRSPRTEFGTVHDYELVGIITQIPYGFDLERDEKCKPGRTAYYTSIVTYIDWIAREMMGRF